MSDHLIAEANRHARAFTIERDQIRTELALLREWQREVIQNANAHHAERKDAITRAERAEAELAKERARLDAVVANCWAVHSEGGSSFSVFSNVCGDYIATAQTYRAAIDAAMQEGGK